MNRPTIRPSIEGVFPRITPGQVVDLCLGNSTMYPVAVIEDDGWGNLFVAVERRGAYAFGAGADAGYVKEKLNLKHDGDAENIADFINDQMHEPGSIKRQGSYMKSCCSK